jgi:predicted deacylase
MMDLSMLSIKFQQKVIMKHIKNWAQSANGLNIECYYSDQAFSQNPILFIGGTHGDEPEGVRLALDLQHYLKQHEAEIKKPWILIPCINPDGLAKNQRVNGHGVDLNRNYPASNWSPEYDKPRYYPGPKPASEPEIQALVKLIEHVKPQALIHFHSIDGPCVVCTGEPGLEMAKTIAEAAGYPVKADIGYPTPGSLSEYGWKDLGIPVICVEEQEKIDLDSIWPRFRKGLLKVLR